jgi:hypothetical protein
MASKKTPQETMKKILFDFVFGSDLSLRNGWAKDFKILGRLTYTGLIDVKGNPMPELF